MFIHKTIFWGTISYMISVFFQCLIILTTLTNMTTTIQEKLKKMFEKGIFMFIYILFILGVYVFSILHSHANIINDEMSPQWSRYASIISILCFVLMIILNVHICTVLSNANSTCIQQKGIIVSHFLLIFVYIQYVISYYYQTDGFTI